MDQNKDIKSLNDIEKANPFSMPESYFEGLTEDIISEIELLKLDDKSEPGFSTPINFFEEQAELITQLAKLKNISSEEEIFSTPDKYFDTLSAKINEAIKQESKEELNIPKENHFEVPAFYFEKQLSEIRSKTTDKKEARIIRPNFTFALTAAASVLLFIVFNFYNNSEKDICKGDLACLSKSDIKSQVESDVMNNQIDEEALMEQIDVEKLNKSLNLDFNSDSKTTNDTLEYLMDNEIDNSLIDEI